MGDKFYITTTIPYVNAPPHIGHALEFVQADAIARYRRLKGEDVYFLSGTDENAIKNVQAAEKAGAPIAAFVAKNAAIFRELLEKLNVSIDDFIRTTEERHVRGAQALWSATKKEDLYEKTYRGLYCVGCELFYKPEELNQDGECFEHPGRKLEEVEEKNYFFKLKNYTAKLRGFIENDTLKIIPETKKNEILSLIRGGLEDFSASRPVERSKGWGVPVPGDPSQTMYVWYDALASYITALGYPDRDAELFKNFWLESPTRIHILGKGVSRFHAVYWPAMLMSANLPLPTLEFIHGYVTIDGQKMSKTIGNVVDPLELVKKYGTDAVRYCLLRELPTFADGDFSEEKFKTSYNANLANGLGNLVARVMALAEANLKAPVARPEPTEFPKAYTAALEAYDLKGAMDFIWERIRSLDEKIAVTEPYKVVKESPEKGRALITELVTELYWIGRMLNPFLPEANATIKATVLANKKPPTLFPRVT
jgi:methionyl-tRNA synthetase